MEKCYQKRNYRKGKTPSFNLTDPKHWSYRKTRKTDDLLWPSI